MKVQLGLKENWRQFTLLVVINAFVGGMVGLERSILPQIAQHDFNMAIGAALFSFIAVFGIVKSGSNYLAGILAGQFGRRRLLISGWIVALPIPFILMWANSWGWIIFANVLLGINQGFAWSSTVVMKIDLVGEHQRGFAMGLNEFAGYLAVALVSFLTGWVASEFGLRPYPFYIGLALVLFGLIGSIFLVQDTSAHVSREIADNSRARLQNVFQAVTWRDRNLGAVTQAGLVNNLNDGMMWGVLPLMLGAKGFSLSQIGLITAVYPAVWGIGQLVTGRLADMFPKKQLLFIGMILQAVALFILVYANSMEQFILIAVVLGLRTALSYPTFLATVAQYTHPLDRAESIGVFRLWRDLGYTFGALMTGIVIEFFNINLAILLVAMITFVSGIFIQFRMSEE